MPIEPLTPETASEYDFVIMLDASGSMGYPSHRMAGKTRWQEAQESIFSMALGLEEYDADGIDVVTFGANTELHEGVTSAKVAELFTLVRPRGSTPLHKACELVINKQRNTGKKMVAICFTDGVPDSQQAVAQVITDASNAIAKDEDLTFLFVQIGDDKEAAAYLKHLDDQLTGKFDIVDTLTVEEADQYEPLELITKAIND